MRRSHVRLTVRNLLLVVAVFALSLEFGLVYRRSWDYHRRQAQFYAYTGGVDWDWRLSPKYAIQGFWAGSSVHGDAIAID